MNENIILIILSVIPWWLIAFLSMFENFLDNPENPKRSSIFLEIVIMPILTFGFGLLINYFSTNLGNWIIGIILGSYICWGVTNMIINHKNKA